MPCFVKKSLLTVKAFPAGSEASLSPGRKNKDHVLNLSILKTKTEGIFERSVTSVNVIHSLKAANISTSHGMAILFFSGTPSVSGPNG